MQFFETLLLLLTLVFLFIQVVGGRQRTFAFFVFGGGIFVILLHGITEVTRWHMFPCYVLFGSLALSLLKRTQTFLAVRLAGLLVGIVLLGTSWFLASQLPILELPAPEGPCLVGTTSFALKDTMRKETFLADPLAPRELFVEVWYPAESVDAQNLPSPVSFWRELYRGERDRVSFFMRYLRGINTHSYPDLPVASSQKPFPVILFNHGLQMFTAQNTVLMEHLASHGYAVFSIGHPYESIRVNLPQTGTILPDFIMGLDNFKEAMAWVEETSRPITAAIDSIEDLQDREQRAAIMLEAVESMPEMNDRVTEWVDDTRFVLDQILSGHIERLDLRDVLDSSRIAVMGMSLGGATSSEFCKTDPRCKAGINIDGLQYGERQRQPLHVPFLMIYSDDAPRVNDFLMLNSTHDFHEYWIPDTRHADFTDLTLAWPLLRQAGQLGAVPGERMIQILNEVILDFLDSYLINGSTPMVSPEEFPEVEIDVKYKSSTKDWERDVHHSIGDRYPRSERAMLRPRS